MGRSGYKKHVEHFEAKLNKLLIDEEKLKGLLLLEKERRCIDRKSLLFLGMANVAGYYWCAIRSVLKSRANELLFFGSYLYDRIRYSYQLGLIDSVPETDVTLLETGNNLTFNDIEKLLRERVSQAEKVSVEFDASVELDEHGKRVMVINPSLPLEQKTWYEAEAKRSGIRIASAEEFPKLRGEFLESTKAEQYPTIRWNFPWRKYLVGGAPDGITDRFVYEFKTTRNRFLASFEKPVALMQADLYGCFFRRKNKRVQIYIMKEDNIETYEEKTDASKAETVLTNFAKVDAGWIPPPPKPWKCKHCDFTEGCPINQT